jgi:hypothetical protein
MKGKIWWLNKCIFMTENQVEQVYKVGTRCLVNKYSRCSMMRQKGDEKGNQNKAKTKNIAQH